jgi:hypothetical protein
MMNRIRSVVQKIIPTSLVLAFVFTAFPASAVFADGLEDPGQPPDSAARFSDERVEQAWERLQQAHERQGQMLDKADTFSGKVQELIDRMKENGKDTSALQAALDAFEAEIRNAHPLYESAKGTINSHKGFDGEGKVTDQNQAVDTIKSLAEKLREVHRLVGEPGKALREALQSLRETRQKEGVSTFQE